MLWFGGGLGVIEADLKFLYCVYEWLNQGLSSKCFETLESPKDGRTKGPEDQRTKGPEDQGTKGPEDQGTAGLKDREIQRPQGLKLA